MAQVLDELKGESLVAYFASFKSEETKENYAIKLRHFLNFCHMQPDDLVVNARKHPRNFESLMVAYIVKRKEEKVTGSTIAMARDAIKLLLEMNDIPEARINWKKINRIIPSVKRHSNDRPPTPDEIRKLLLHLGLRLKAAVLLLASSGIRVGALKWLHWQDLQPVEAAGYKFAKLKVYAGEPEEYVAFITPESYEALLEFRKIRELRGEKITGQSPLIITKQYSDTTEIKPINPKVFRNFIGKTWKQINRGEAQRNGSDSSNRYEFKQVHGFRKFYKTTCEAKMKSLYVEILMGHSVGVSNSYMKPSDGELAEEYAKAIPALTILTGGTSVTQSDVELQVKKGILAYAGFSQDDMKSLDKSLEQYTIPELSEVVRNKQNGTNAAGQKIIPLDELDAYIEKDYEYIPSEYFEKKGKAVVRLSS